WRSAGALRPGGTRCLGASSPRAAIGLDEPPFLWRRLVGAPAPGANSVVCLVARWASPPAAPRTSWCSSLPGLHRLGVALRWSAARRGRTLPANVEPTGRD